MKLFIKKDLAQIIQDWHLKICLAIVIFFSLFIFILGLSFENTNQFIPWWVALLYGWSSIVVALRLTSNLYED